MLSLETAMKIITYLELFNKAVIKIIWKVMALLDKLVMTTQN